MISIKGFWAYITGDYQGLKDNLNRKIADLERRKSANPEDVDYCNALIDNFNSQMEELDRKIEAKSQRN